jgi:hypothetical protein
MADAPVAAAGVADRPAVAGELACGDIRPEIDSPMGELTNSTLRGSAGVKHRC